MDNPANDSLAPVQLAAGPLTLEFDPAIAFIRYIRLGGTEILRGIHVAVRDQVWNTAVPKISDLRIESNAADFDVRFTAECVLGPLDYVWKGALTGAADGTIRFSMDGLARSTFLRNRIGLCVLHPLKECAGAPCKIETSAGVEEASFPQYIAPHQPFKDLRAISHQVMPGVRAEVRFEGDIFETEDHRNWTDANFKTYSTPLDLPMPARVEAGTTIAQSVTLRLLKTADVPLPKPAVRSSPIRLMVAAEEGRLPFIGFGAPGRKLSAAEQGLLAAIRPAHLRVDLCLFENDWRSNLAMAREAAFQVGSDLECAVTVDKDAAAQLQELRQELPPSGVARVFVFHTDEPSTTARWVELARHHLPASLSIGAGTRSHFVDINRKRPPVDLLDAICYAAHPQVHAWDDVTCIENLEGQSHTVRSARAFAGTKWIAVGPVTLGPRTPDAIDARQRSPFGCAWTLGSVCALSEAGADSATYCELAGINGLMDGDEVLPLYSVFHKLGQYAGSFMRAVHSSEPLCIGAMDLHNGNQQGLFVVNYTPERQTVETPDGSKRELQPFEITVL
jgi:hypothetical protein